MSLRLALLLAICLPATPILAQSDRPTADEIVTALLPHGMDGRRIKGARSADAVFSGAGTRGVGVEEGDGGAAPPSIDLLVEFEYDSDVLTNDGALLLDQLGIALADAALSGALIRIVGHTDAVGSDDYNLSLSLRRAETVLAYVVARHDIDPARLTVAGLGKSALIPGIDPEDGRNRRVEVQNVSILPECSLGASCASNNSGG